MFADQLSRIAGIDATRATEYGVAPTEFHAAQQRTLSWATQLRTGIDRARANGLGIDTPAPPPERDYGIDL